VVKLNLPQCLQLALERQPRLAAYRASLAAAEAGSQALETLRIPAIIDRELPIRRRQASLGVSAAAAALDQAERDVNYAVTRTYFTVLYARAQERVAASIVARLSATRDTAKQALDAGARNVTSNDVRRTTVYLGMAKTRQTQAAHGVQRALAALKEAIGVGPEAALDVADGSLPEPDPRLRPDRDEIISLALARRGDLVRAGIFAEVTCLEVQAQATSYHPKMATFAAGSDVHAQQVPLGVHNTEYRPGAVPPEMPTLLVGSRPERVQRARALHARADAVVDATRNLVALEAQDAYLRWQQATRQVAEVKDAARTGDELADDLTKDFTSGAKVRVEDVVNARVLASQARSQYNEYLYQQLLALADLERLTGGGYNAGLVGSSAFEVAPPGAEESGR
jgi:outer membrane protein TolC